MTTVTWCVIVSTLRRLRKTEISPLIVGSECVEREADSRFLGVHTEENLSSSELVKKAQQWLSFLRMLREENITQRLMVSFYRAAIESILSHCIFIWFNGCTVAQRNAIQRVINSAQKLVGCCLHTQSDTSPAAQNISKDTSHPGHSLFEILPSGQCYR